MPYDRRPVPEDTPIEYDEKLGLWLRTKTTDRDIAKEVAREYRGLDVQEGDVVLDIGSHVGSTIKLFRSLGAKKVIGVEPDPYNFAILEKNVGQDKGVILHESAVNATGGDLKLYTNPRRSKASHSTADHYPRRQSRWVSGVKFQWLLDTYRSNKIKIDCEGAEYEMFDSIRGIPAEIKGIVMELHLTRKTWRKKEGPELAQRLIDEGFEVVKQPRFTVAGWHSIGCWRR